MSIFTHCIRFGIDWGLCADKMKSFITRLGSLVRLNAAKHELLVIQLNSLSVCVLQGIQDVQGTLHTMAVLAPIRAAWTH